MAPKTIMIGYDHHCGSLGKIDDYFKGKYAYKQEDGVKKLPRLLDRLGGEDENASLSDMGNYWPDYFFTHNIHIIGIGMPLVESDLWWVLNKKCRYQKVCPQINNTIYFYGTQNDDKVIPLLESFDVQVVRTEVQNDNWRQAYQWMFTQMGKNMK